jgi:O-antigen ligase
VAIGLAYAALISGAVRSVPARALVLAVLVLNAASMLLTYERTFWVGAIVAVAFVTMRMGGRSRLRGLVLTPLAVLVGVAALAALAPSEFVTARERLLSINQYGSDNSLRYRLIESRHVAAKIEEHPVVGSGLADTIWWGRPYAGVPPESYAFSHNGYLWLAWKLGIPLTALLVLLVMLAVFWRGPPGEDRLFKAVRAGCQGGLLALLVINVTWPAFRILSITPVIGLFVAICAAGAARPQSVSERSSAT